MSATGLLPSQLQQTPLHHWHQSNGAKLVDFSGWAMPLQYGKVLAEHHTVRQKAGLFDICHMGLILVQGPLDHVKQFLNGLVPQDINKLVAGKAVYTQFLNDSGGIIDDIIVYQLPDSPATGFSTWSGLLLIVNAGNRQTDLDWLTQHVPQGISVSLVSHQYGLLALQGPQFSDVLATMGCPAQALPKRFWINGATLTLDQQSFNVMLSRTGYTGEDGVEVIAPVDQLPALWEALLTAGQAVGLAPIGLAARDTLRLEAAYPLHGHDISEAITPLQAGLGWSVKLDKAEAFIGQTALASQPITQTAVCLAIEGRSIARQHDPVLTPDGHVLGEVTSGSISPTLGYPIAMAMVKAGDQSLIAIGATLMIDSNGRQLTATVVKRPFYSRPLAT
jgi:aminomethyltransferase